MLQIRCHDVAPYMITSQASLDDINCRLEEHISMGQLRPNIEVNGCGSYAEVHTSTVKPPLNGHPLEWVLLLCTVYV